MSGELFLFVSEALALSMLAVAGVLVLVRLLRGPGLPDRILALDMMTVLTISIIGVLTLRTGVPLLLDIAIALCLVGFVATIALARFVLSRGEPAERDRAGGGGE